MLALFFVFSLSKIQIDPFSEHRFIEWMRNNDIYYIGDEYYFRLGLFLSHCKYLQSYNKRPGLTFRLAVNKFACTTLSEYKSILGLQFTGNNPNQRQPTTKSKYEVPDSFDWRDKNVVNAIRDQGKCGSCWSFSAIATSESAYAISTGNLLTFSEQNLIDCTTNCYGCNGGEPNAAINYVIKHQNGQFNSCNTYPYTGEDGKCSFDPKKSIGKITSYISVEQYNENDLKEKVAQYGVASCCIAAGNIPFMSYQSGILDNHECFASFLDHAVACVGYGTENGIDYWIVRNSWGTNWGEDGYVRMKRNDYNQCGIASHVFVAI